MKDALERELKKGDEIAYACRAACLMYQRVGQVVEVKKRSIIVEWYPEAGGKPESDYTELFTERAIVRL